ncbi:MAG: hypothetical protein J6K17_13765 [Oscillospiraceae bacterium]|nr:hypothetical protein [Oscillospiraceae bacterium]
MNNENNSKKLCVSSLVLGIVGLVFSLFLPFVSYGCSIPGLVIGLKKQHKDYNSRPGIILNVIAIALSIVNSALGIIMTVKLFFASNSDEE